jgi:hypothetical protein
MSLRGLAPWHRPPGQVCSSYEVISNYGKVFMLKGFRLGMLGEYGVTLGEKKPKLVEHVPDYMLVVLNEIITINQL